MKKINKIFKKSKSIALDTYLEKVLYDKSFGYYQKKNPFGINGDFVTAPNISNVFCEMISIWLISFWENLGKPEKINFVEEFNNYILLSVPTRFIRDWVTSRYLDQILLIIKNYRKDIIRIEFKIVEQNKVLTKKEKDLEHLSTKENISFIKDSFLQYNRIDPNKRFDNFITGSSNKLAFEASLKVSENVSQYNPLYIYGGVGMGKTHLLNSIGFELKKNNKVMFISAERFMYQFVKSIKANEMVKFKEYFRNTNILIIDDIQFMNGKEAMQEEFFHTFNALIDKDSQIILSADRPPNKLSRIQERIKSRFSGGLVVDIQKPDYELRKK